MKFKTIVNNLKSSHHLKLIKHLCFIKKVNNNPIKKYNKNDENSKI